MNNLDLEIWNLHNSVHQQNFAIPKIGQNYTPPKLAPKIKGLNYINIH